MAKGDVLEVISAGSNAASTNSQTFSSAPTTGMLVLLVVHISQADSVAPDLPSGFTLLGSSLAVMNTYSNVFLYGKIAGGSESATYTVTNASSAFMGLIAYKIEGTFSNISEVTGYANAGDWGTSALAIPASAATISGSSLVIVGAVNHGDDASITFDGSFANAANTSGGLYTSRRTYSSGTAQTNADLSSGSARGGGVMAVIALGPTAPIISSGAPTSTIGTQTTATLGLTTNQTTGTAYWVVDTASNISGVTAAQVKAGNNKNGTAAFKAANASVSTTTPSAGVTGLAAGTAYSVAAVQNNSNGDSNLITWIFTTAASALTTAVTIVDAAGANIANTSLIWFLVQGGVLTDSGTNTSASGVLTVSTPNASAGAAEIFYNNSGNTLSGRRAVTVS